MLITESWHIIDREISPFPDEKGNHFSLVSRDITRAEQRVGFPCLFAKHERTRSPAAITAPSSQALQRLETTRSEEQGGKTQPAGREAS
jgi:hypothetical protein